MRKKRVAGNDWSQRPRVPVGKEKRHFFPSQNEKEKFQKGAPKRMLIRKKRTQRETERTREREPAAVNEESSQVWTMKKRQGPQQKEDTHRKARKTWVSTRKNQGWLRGGYGPVRKTEKLLGPTTWENATCTRREGGPEQVPHA